MIGAEWWYMWGSENFNGQIKAFHWSTVPTLRNIDVPNTLYAS